MEKALTGVRAELHDCAFPLLEDVVCTSDPTVGFKDIDYAFMVGSKPRGPGMERADLLKDNGQIFVSIGKAMSDHAKRTCKTIVVGNPKHKLPYFAEVRRGAEIIDLRGASSAASAGSASIDHMRDWVLGSDKW